jgi:GT2 family glycosyltransferase
VAFNVRAPFSHASMALPHACPWVAMRGGRPAVTASATVPPRVAIVILNWRRREETAACLRSLALLDYENHTILVVDNGSGDGSAEWLRREFPSVTMHATASNLGFAEGCNTGIRVALADVRHPVDYVLLLNNDTRVEPPFLRHMVSAAEAAPDAAAVGAVNLCGDGHTSSGGYIRWWTGRYVDALDQRPLATLEIRPVVDVDTVAGSTMLLRAALLRAGELLDPGYFCVFEETDWCVRLRRRGARILLATGARVEHRAGGTMGRPLQLYYRFRNRPYFMLRNARAVHWLTFLPYYLAEATVRVVAYVLLGRGGEARGVAFGVWDGMRARRGPGRLAELVQPHPGVPTPH